MHRQWLLQVSVIYHRYSLPPRCSSTLIPAVSAFLRLHHLLIAFQTCIITKQPILSPFSYTAFIHKLTASSEEREADTSGYSLYLFWNYNISISICIVFYPLMKLSSKLNGYRLLACDGFILHAKDAVALNLQKLLRCLISEHSLQHLHVLIISSNPFFKET